MCPKCDRSPAHAGISCIENMQKIEKEKEHAAQNQDAQADAIVNAGSKIVKCPKCGSYCELYEGCQFMTCLSSFCLKRTHFCNLCGKQLTDKGHWGHYTLKGPYGDTCNTLDKIEDAEGVAIEGTELVKLLSKSDVKNEKGQKPAKVEEEKKDEIPQ